MLNATTNFDALLQNDTENLQSKYKTLVALYARFAPSILIVDRSITPFWYFLGLFGNLLSAYVWMHPRVRRKNSSAVYLAALSVWDLIFLALHPFQEVREAWMGISENSLLDCGLLHIPLLTAQYMSPVLVLCFTVERWIAIWFPFKRDSLCTPKRACIVTVVMICIVFFYNLIQLKFRRYDYELSVCIVNTQAVEWTVYTSISEIIFSGFVPISALVFNILVAIELYRITVVNKHMMPNGDGGDASAERKFRSTTLMLLCVSFFVIVTSLPAGLLYALQNQNYGNVTLTDSEVEQDSTWQSYFSATLTKKIVDELSISHYSLNFVIYLLTGPQYRMYAHQLLSSIFGGCCRLIRGRVGQPKEQLKQREDYYFNNSRTNRAKRLSERNSTMSRTNATAVGRGSAELDGATTGTGGDTNALSPLIVKSTV
ncbi:hypothetical protein BOX15_Mlig007315g1 [Macrostomum lignano]|uniref:G-protein coupled receptors family 1 profile domain-containing protein n=1 Tax=Macrostomum lignano TaxID=282301 RepID=A0A267F7F2_9PLAT|nr:hypothetical protein BOX15_Mlig007315g1 [Macrostomum lignano]